MNLSYLTESSYWLGTNTDLEGNFYIAYLVVFSVLFILAMAIIFFSRGELRRVWTKYSTPLLFSSILGWIYLFAVHEQLPWLSVRLTLLIVTAGPLIWILILLFWSAKQVPKIIKTRQVEEKFKQYLPKVKKN